VLSYQSMSSTLSKPSTIYGPVYSWRVGWSLGVDMLYQSSICSFNCIYCQLGDIQVKTAERKIYVPTEQVEWDFKNSDWEKADIVTFSGSGEPTLALNIAEVIDFIKEYAQKPVMVLTNATLLHDPAVRADLRRADIVAAKLDGATEAGLRQMNRPVPGVTLESILSGIEALRAEYTGKLCLQCMFMPANLKEAELLAEHINRLQTDEVQLNTPKRPYPKGWFLDSRGNHDAAPYPAVPLKTVSEAEAEEIEHLLAARTGRPIVSVYKKQAI
jgi:wyosine [tRNA(Phe)-imidazoG37] synthetase (radical SAM superfamily)